VESKNIAYSIVGTMPLVNRIFKRIQSTGENENIALPGFKQNPT